MWKDRISVRNYTCDVWAWLRQPRECYLNMLLYLLLLCCARTHAFWSNAHQPYNTIKVKIQTRTKIACLPKNWLNHAHHPHPTTLRNYTRSFHTNHALLSLAPKDTRAFHSSHCARTGKLCYCLTLLNYRTIMFSGLFRICLTRRPMRPAIIQFYYRGSNLIQNKTLVLFSFHSVTWLESQSLFYVQIPGNFGRRKKWVAEKFINFVVSWLVVENVNGWGD